TVDGVWRDSDVVARAAASDPALSTPDVLLR
ncbi:MAG: hypothetical protein V7603_109, partial [Micromonosporaceae bacterium]